MTGDAYPTLVRKIKKQGTKYGAHSLLRVWKPADWLHRDSGHVEHLQKHESSICWRGTLNRSSSILCLEISVHRTFELSPKGKLHLGVKAEAVKGTN